jgi:myo-inositol-1(or 4)-monophosphatase
MGHSGGDPGHTWICDPIDGTANFADGLPVWGTSLAYWLDGRPESAWVYFPALGQMFTARRGAGALLNGNAIRPSRAPEYSLLTSVGLESRTHLWYTLQLRARVRILGSAIANLCYTANGSLVASITRAKLWDVAAGVLILQEAGCVLDNTPALDSIDAARYGWNGNPTPRILVAARANAQLRPLTDFLRPAGFLER